MGVACRNGRGERRDDERLMTSERGKRKEAALGCEKRHRDHERKKTEKKKERESEREREKV